MDICLNLELMATSHTHARKAAFLHESGGSSVTLVLRQHRPNTVHPDVDVLGDDSISFCTSSEQKVF